MNHHNFIAFVPSAIKHDLILKHLGKNPCDLKFAKTKEVTLVGTYLGRICSKCKKNKCSCEGSSVVKMHSFTPFTVKYSMIRKSKGIKTIIIDDIFRRVKVVDFSDNICFKVKETKELFYLFINNDGYVEIKFIQGV